MDDNRLEELYRRNRETAERAVNIMGGQANTGRILTERLREKGIRREVTVGMVWAWLNRDKCGIPIRYLLDMEEESGIPRQELRQDIPWP